MVAGFFVVPAITYDTFVRVVRSTIERMMNGVFGSFEFQPLVKHRNNNQSLGYVLAYQSGERDSIDF